MLGHIQLQVVVFHPAFQLFPLVGDDLTSLCLKRSRFRGGRAHSLMDTFVHASSVLRVSSQRDYTAQTQPIVVNPATSSLLGIVLCSLEGVTGSGDGAFLVFQEGFPLCFREVLHFFPVGLIPVGSNALALPIC